MQFVFAPPPPYPLGTDPDPSFTKKDGKKTFMFIYVLWLLYDILSLKNYVNVPSKSNKQKKIFLLSEGRWRKYQDPDPDPLVRGTNQRILIRTKMSRIRNTDHDARFLYHFLWKYLMYLNIWPHTCPHLNGTSRWMMDLELIRWLEPKTKVSKQWSS